MTKTQLFEKLNAIRPDKIEITNEVPFGGNKVLIRTFHFHNGEGRRRYRPAPVLQFYLARRQIGFFRMADPDVVTKAASMELKATKWVSEWERSH